MVTGRTNIAFFNTEVACGLLIGIFTYDLGLPKGRSPVHAHFDCEYLANEQELLCSTQKVACGILTFDRGPF